MSKSKMILPALLFIASFLYQSQAFSRDLSLHDLVRRDGQAITEWTAMGDSYGSGVGAGPQPADDTNRCFRFPQAYPPIMQSGPGSIQPNPLKWNNVACSGNTFQQILDKEFLDEPVEDGRYGTRPVWGTAPEFATITMGGNDVGILNLVATCILSFKLWGLDCDQVIDYGNSVVAAPEFKSNITAVIQKAVTKGRGTGAGPAFKFFVTGYARFFNQETTQCNDVTFKPTWNPLAAQYLTIERRTAMNGLALNLNNALKEAVTEFNDPGVIYIDYDAQFEGHRFCDREEPNPNDDDTWFFNWYTTDDPTAQALFAKIPAYSASLTNSTPSNGFFQTDADFINALGDAAGDDPAALSVMSDSVRIFHPKSFGHQEIRNVVIQAIQAAGIQGSQPTSTTAAAPPPVSATASSGPTPQQQCHARCPPGLSPTSSDYGFCIEECGCFEGAAGC